MNSTPTIQYKTAKNSDFRLPQKLCKKYDVNSSKRSFNSNSKSRSSGKWNKEFGRLITKSKLRLSANISKPNTSTSKYSKIDDLRLKRLEETNEILRKENAQLRKYLNYDVEYLLKSHKTLSKSIEELEEILSNALQELNQEREAWRKIFEEYTALTREKEKDIMNAEMDKNYLETKNSLLKEVNCWSYFRCSRRETKTWGRLRRATSNSWLF